MQTPIERLAVYDLDKTITYAPTWTSFLVRTAFADTPWRLALLPVAGLATLGYVVKLVDRAQLKEITHRLLLGRAVSADRMARAASRFADHVIAHGVFAGALDRIAADRAAGYRIVMATASYRFYARAIGDRLGFDAVIGTQAIRHERRIVARISGSNCYGPAKLKMIKAWMKREGIAREDVTVRFYSDHASDAPTLDWADEAFAVHAHGPLRTMAKAKGWTILDWAR